MSNETPKKTLNQERVMAILSAASQILSAYDILSKHLDILRQSNEKTISIDLLYEIFAKYRPPSSATQLIAAEKAHFEARWMINQRARQGMKKIRNERKGLARDFNITPARALNLEEDKSEAKFQPQEYSVPIQESDYSLPDSPSLGDYHELARQKFGAVLIFKGEICRAIQEAKPELSADEIVMIVERLLDEIPEGKSIQYFSQGSRDRVLINDIP